MALTWKVPTVVHACVTEGPVSEAPSPKSHDIAPVPVPPEVVAVNAMEWLTSAMSSEAVTETSGVGLTTTAHDVDPVPPTASSAKRVRTNCPDCKLVWSAKAPAASLPSPKLHSKVNPGFPPVACAVIEIEELTSTWGNVGTENVAETEIPTDTVRAGSPLTDAPKESVTVTVIANTPTAVGEQLSRTEFSVTQPAGSPEYAIVETPAPPLYSSKNWVDCPKSID